MADFQETLPQLISEKIKVLAGSVDPLEKAKGLREELRITYPIAYAMNAEEIAKNTGAFYEEKKKFLHATGFLLRPDKSIAVACYSSGPIGRLVAKDVLNVVKFYKSKQ